MQQISIFEARYGWCGLLSEDGRLAALSIAHATPGEARCALDRKTPRHENVPEEFDWAPGLRERLLEYMEGYPVDFRDVAVATPPSTEFQERVLGAVRTIPYGETLTYAQLAELAASPGAARAVGNVMASNRVPIVIPCHRVVASGGGLGGYSAPQGTTLKRRLLDMEAAARNAISGARG